MNEKTHLHCTETSFNHLIQIIIQCELKVETELNIS